MYFIQLYPDYQDDHLALMAVGVVEGTSEAIFQTFMSIGPSRSEYVKALMRQHQEVI